VNLQPVHIVCVSVNVIWVTSQGPCGERVHQFHVFAILQYVVKLVIKPRIFSTIARQPVLTWQTVCTQIVVGGFKCYHPSMKTIRSSSTQLWHILPVPMWSWPVTYFLQNWATWPGCGG